MGGRQSEGENEMRLYDSLGPNPQIVRIFAAEKGITLETVPVDIMGGENRQDGYKAVNPMAQLPALETDSGQIITEVVAICEFWKSCIRSRR
jgi:glutathione S-transferase